MITEKVKQYIETNRLCRENLFYDWEQFLELLFAEGGKVESVLWFEHVLISEQVNSLGGGGYSDREDPDYMFAETYIFDSKMEDKSLQDIKEYVQAVLASHPNNKLLPSFFIIK
ncbi:MAG: hypothetical protein IIW56_10155 [Oscillospiraceae bacterium]|nr:hypothetical protein [Oscillospiraceae bacterium]